MSGPSFGRRDERERRSSDGDRVRAADRRRVRWPVLGVVVLLGLLLALTTLLERSAPVTASSAPSVQSLADEFQPLGQEGPGAVPLLAHMQGPDGLDRVIGQ